MPHLSERHIVLTLASLSAITPLAIDMYLPALPAIAQEFHTPIAQVEFSLSLYFFGMAMGQLLGGPISDAYGRRSMVTFGLFLFGISSLWLAITPDIQTFWLLRALQAFGGGIATVNVSATVRDRFSGKESARIFSLIATIMLMAPLMAPTLGSLILKFFQWQSIFILLGFYAFVALYFYRKRFVATAHEKQKITPIKNYLAILSHKQAMVFIISQILCTSGMYTFITSSSFIYMEHFQASASQFALFFAANVAMMILVGRFNARLVKHKEPFNLLRFGVLSQAVLGVLLFSMRDANVWVVFPLTGLYIGILGFIFGNSVSLALEFFPTISASANAVIGVLQYSTGALAGFVASFFHDGTLFPITMVMMCVSLCGAVLLIAGTKNYTPHHSHEC